MAVPFAMVWLLELNLNSSAESGRSSLGYSVFMVSAEEGGSDRRLDALLALAREAASRSYSPYSRFRVGAALLLAGGETVTGTNVENASYGLTICAERSAVAAAVSRFGPSLRIAAVAVTNLEGRPSPPCGACRQVLAEFIEPAAAVIFPAADGVRVMPFAEIMPLTFDLGPR